MRSVCLALLALTIVSYWSVAFACTLVPGYRVEPNRHDEPRPANAELPASDEGFSATCSTRDGSQSLRPASSGRREWIGTTRYRAYATKVAMANNTNVIAAELISLRAT